MASTLTEPNVALTYCRPDSSPTDSNPSQKLAHASTAYELLFGGEVFGGKTDFLIAESIMTALEVPGAAVAFGRAALKDLTGHGPAALLRDFSSTSGRCGRTAAGRIGGCTVRQDCAKRPPSFRCVRQRAGQRRRM